MAAAPSRRRQLQPLQQQRDREDESVFGWEQLQQQLPSPAATASITRRASNSSSGAAAGGPRIKTLSVAAPSAAPPRRMHEDSSQVESILKPVRGIRDAQRRAGLMPTNHARHNVQAVMEQSRLNALQKAADTDMAAQRGDTRHGSRALPAGSGGARSLRRASSSSSSSGGGGGGGGSGSLRNFVEENKAAAAAAAGRRPVKAEARRQAGSYLTKSEYGQVPAYLLERRLQMAEEEQALVDAREAASIPPGLRRMPEPERLETLALLATSRREVEARLGGLSITSDTHSTRRQREGLEQRLVEIGEAQKLFSRPGVLVAVKQTRQHDDEA